MVKRGLFKDAVVFRNAFSQATKTRPSCPSIMTSLLPTATGVFDFHDRVLQCGAVFVGNEKNGLFGVMDLVESSTSVLGQQVLMVRRGLKVLQVLRVNKVYRVRSGLWVLLDHKV